MTTEVVVLKDATKDWLKIATSPAMNNELFIFTPYVTGTILNEIIDLAEGKIIHFITSLNVMSVISKSVDLEIIKTLLDRKISVYSCPDLHAKLMYNGNSGVIGSQNYTRKGTRNLEASVLLDLNQVNQQIMDSLISDVILNSTRLTSEIVLEFESECEKYSEKFTELRLLIK